VATYQFLKKKPRRFYAGFIVEGGKREARPFPSSSPNIVAKRRGKRTEQNCPKFFHRQKREGKARRGGSSAQLSTARYEDRSFPCWSKGGGERKKKLKKTSKPSHHLFFQGKGAIMLGLQLSLKTNGWDGKEKKTVATIPRSIFGSGGEKESKENLLLNLIALTEGKDRRLHGSSENSSIPHPLEKLWRIHSELTQRQPTMRKKKGKKGGEKREKNTSPPPPSSHPLVSLLLSRSSRGKGGKSRS